MSAAWLAEYAVATRTTNVLAARTDQRALFTAGLVGEAGGILAELKKVEREGPAYPLYRRRLTEEVGDFLWYFVRLCELADVDVATLDTGGAASIGRALDHALQLAASVGRLAALPASANPPMVGVVMVAIWPSLVRVAEAARVSLEEAARANLTKTLARWPRDRLYVRLFDEDAPSECQLPRRLTMEFHEIESPGRPQVLLRCHELNIGDRVSDNAYDDDGYRFHDVFHLAHAVHLGWSPVLRALLRCKRKHDPRLDEVEDGARAIVLEEAIAALTYRRARQLYFFERQDQLDFDLLKSIAEIAAGLEVAAAPFWQWEAAILDGYRVFRQLRTNGGGRVTLDLTAHQLIYDGPCAGARPQLLLPGVALGTQLAQEAP